MSVGVTTYTDLKDPEHKVRHEGFRHRDDVQSLVDELRAKGIPAFVDVTGACSSDADGHYHAAEIIIRGITAKDARKLLR